MRSRGGRLLVVGGQRNEFSLVQAIYEMTEAAGIGACLAIVPDSLRKLIGETGYARFVPASASGSLGKAALGELLGLAADFDALIIGANLTNNAETGVMIESLITKLETPMVITEEVIEILKFYPTLITENPRALVVTTMAGLFALANHHHMPIAIRPNGGVVGKIEILQQLATISKCSYVVFDHEIFANAEGEISLTALPQTLTNMPAAVVGAAATFWLQHPGKAFTALTSAAYVLAEASTPPVSSYSSFARQMRGVLQALE